MVNRTNVFYENSPGSGLPCDYNRYNPGHEGQSTSTATFNGLIARCCESQNCRNWAADVVLGRIDERGLPDA